MEGLRMMLPRLVQRSSRASSATASTIFPSYEPLVLIDVELTPLKIAKTEIVILLG